MWKNKKPFKYWSLICCINLIYDDEFTNLGHNQVFFFPVLHLRVLGLILYHHGFHFFQMHNPKVWTSKQNKVLGNAEAETKQFFPHAVAQAWIVLPNSLVLVTQGRGGGSGDVPAPLLPHSLAVTLTLMWDNAECFPLGFLAELPEHFLPDFLFYTLSPWPIQARGSSRGWGSTLSHQGLLQGRGQTPGPGISPHSSMSSSQSFLPHLDKLMALMFI